MNTQNTEPKPRRRYDREDFTPEKVNAALDEALKEKGEDYIYPRVVKTMPEGEVAEKPFFPDQPDAPWGTTCLYVHDEEEGQIPGCIVGNVMHRLGVPLEDLKKVEGDNAHGLIGQLQIPVNQHVTRLLNRAQASQDEGQTWGKAVQAARAWYDEDVRVQAEREARLK